jgi:hypothetical protein
MTYKVHNWDDLNDSQMECPQQPETPQLRHHIYLDHWDELIGPVLRCTCGRKFVWQQDAVGDFLAPPTELIMSGEQTCYYISNPDLCSATCPNCASRYCSRLCANIRERKA